MYLHSYTLWLLSVDNVRYGFVPLRGTDYTVGTRSDIGWRCPRHYVLCDTQMGKTALSQGERLTFLFLAFFVSVLAFKISFPLAFILYLHYWRLYYRTRSA